MSRKVAASVPRSAKRDTPKLKYDDRGFDPRDGGKIGKQHVPKWRPVSNQVRKALRGKLGNKR
jgi:hypothetical protein